MNTTEPKVPTDAELIKVLEAARRGELDKKPWGTEFSRFVKDYADYLLSNKGVAHIEALRAQLNSRTD